MASQNFNWYYIFIFAVSDFHIFISLYHILSFFLTLFSFGALFFALRSLWLLSCFHYKKMNYDVDRHNFHWLYGYFIFILSFAIERIGKCFYTKWGAEINEEKKREKKRQRKTAKSETCSGPFLYRRAYSNILNDRIWITLHMNWIDANMVQCFIIIISVQCMYILNTLGYANQVKHEHCTRCAVVCIRHAYSSKAESKRLFHSYFQRCMMRC